MQYRFVYAGVNSGTKASTSCKNFVKIGPAVSKEYMLKCEVCAVTRPQFDDRRLFVAVAFQNELKYRSYDFSALIGNDHFCTLCRKILRLSLVTQEFKT